jgi:hypothetical protein
MPVRGIDVVGIDSVPVHGIQCGSNLWIRESIVVYVLIICDHSLTHVWIGISVV